MKTPDDPLMIATNKLDDLQTRLGAFERLQRRGHSLDREIIKDIGDLENLYAHNLETLRSLKAYNEYKAYSAWWKRYWNVGEQP